jgi:hypothetical protein
MKGCSLPGITPRGGASLAIKRSHLLLAENALQVFRQSTYCASLEVALQYSPD